MATETKIEWTDHTFNPWRGCTKVSLGCANCYAEQMSKRNPDVLGVWGDQGKRVIASESYWRQPLKWNREAQAAGERRRVFCASLADVFEDRPELTMSRCKLFWLIHQTPYLDWLLLTKRPEGIRDRLHECSTQEDGEHGDSRINDGACLAYQWKHGSPMPTVWLGVSVEDQKRADERIPILLKTPAAVRFLSCEPLLESLNLVGQPDRSCRECFGSGISDNPITGRVDCGCGGDNLLDGIDWVIVGGESGAKARQCSVNWIRGIIEQCRAVQVPVFVKQLGRNPVNTSLSGARRPIPLYYVDRKGANIEEFPEDLRVREWPASRR